MIGPYLLQKSYVKQVKSYCPQPADDNSRGWPPIYAVTQAPMPHTADHVEYGTLKIDHNHFQLTPEEQQALKEINQDIGQPSYP